MRPHRPPFQHIDRAPQATFGNAIGAMLSAGISCDGTVEGAEISKAGVSSNDKVTGMADQTAAADQSCLPPHAEQVAFFMKLDATASLLAVD